jgi:hypothetical protein
MTVDPQHQYRGAGTLMTKWGTELADEMNALVGSNTATALLDTLLTLLLLG